mgnify:CR=1 FL=1
MKDKQEDFDYDRYFRSYREIDNYIENYPDATTNSLINAVLHYWDHDDFLD